MYDICSNEIGEVICWEWRGWGGTWGFEYIGNDVKIRAAGTSREGWLEKNRIFKWH